MNISTSMNENILDNLSTALLSLDHELRLCFINPAAESLLDISGTRSRGQRVSDLFRETRELESLMYEALQTGQPYTRRKTELKLQNGQAILADYTITPVNEAEWPRLLMEVQPLDRYLRIDRDEAIRSHQQTTRQMIRGLAHEIKNPLGGIRGSAQLLARQLTEPDQLEYTNVIIEETDRLTSLVDRLLGPNSLPKPAMANIHELLERIHKLIEMESERHIDIVRDYDPSIPEIYIDPELMIQAILNVARNAAQSLEQTPNPQLKLVTRTERQFTIGRTCHRLVIKVDIIDNGPGI
ncbi:MAG: PAS domain-containing protein, partial [Pseudomonadales bacterium]|nr:PAS domain-containing protein [Pseudomonadales bacterium]